MVNSSDVLFHVMAEPRGQAPGGMLDIPVTAGRDLPVTAGLDLAVTAGLYPPVMAGLDPAIPATAVPAVNYPFLMVRAGRDDRATGLIRQHFTYTTMPNERTTR